MRVLLGHNYYRSSAPSGEDIVFRTERALLERNRVEVIPFERFNDDIDESTLGKRVRIALDTAWSERTYRELRGLITKTRPDVAHFHNTFPVISPSAYAACQDEGVPVVQTLHNYRLICPGALLMRNGAPCEQCVGTNLLPALRHCCYRGSLPATGALVWMLTSNRRRGTYRRLVNRYIALTRFAADRLIAGGLPADRVEVKANFISAPPASGGDIQNYAVYVGRLGEEKGVRTLLRAWQDLTEIPLKVIGDGPLRSELEGYAQSRGLPVEFLGFRLQQEVLKLVGAAMLQIVPSEWYEGFPMVVLEAYACGTPVIASRIGSLEEIVTEEVGGHFRPGDAHDLVKAVRTIIGNRDRLMRMRRGARSLFEEKYSAEKNYVELMGVYERAKLDFHARKAR